MQTPKIDQNQLSPLAFQTIYTDDDQLLLHGQLSDETVTKQTLEHPIFEQCVFENMTLTDNNFFRAEVNDVIFKNCDLSNCQFEKAVFYRVQLINCKLVGTTFDKAFIKEVQFDQCNLNLANLNEAKLTKVTFQASRLTEINCMETTLKQVKFTQSDLNNADLTNTNLHRLDLSTCQFKAIRMQPFDIRGCRVNAEQALYFANQFLELRID